ncbi:MAG: DHA2 family efflux MFS transporter permease subunit [Mycobacterium sp.]
MTTALRRRPAGGAAPAENPWNALWAMMVGFFMILVDATIVAVANPSIMEKLGAGYDAVIWVTSAYLLAFAVPLLVAGRLGDRYGPKNLYLLGLAVFTAASLWCGLADSIGMLIAARVVQGVGAALLTPQTLSTITRIFPSERRGVAMSVWGATAGVATLVGPLAGGILVDGLGWQWIFIVNVPIGIIGLGLALWLIPELPTQKHRFDLIGVLLSGVGMFLIVFALQEGQSHDWAPWVWGTLAGGIGFMAAFIFWQQANRDEPLIPLVIFRDRDFSLSNLGIATIGFVVTAMILPVMFYAQAVCGLSPTRSALLTAPMAIATGVLAPFVGKIVDRSHPRPVIGFGFSMLAIALTWLSIEMTPTTPIWRLLLPLTAMGVGMAFIWSPLAATATRHLPPELAGAGSGVYNATRQVGAVLGSASMAAFMTSRIGAEMPLMATEAPSEGSVTQLPGFLHGTFADAMSQSLLLPAFIALFGVIAALFLLGFGASSKVVAVAEPDDRAEEPWYDDEIPDDDEYFEFTVFRDEPEPVAEVVEQQQKFLSGADEGDTAPMAARHDHLLTAPATSWHWGQHPPEGQEDEPVESWQDLLEEELSDPVTEPAPVAEPLEPAPIYESESRRSLLDFLADVPPPKPSVEPIGFAHNGFHVDEAKRFQPLSRFESSPAPKADTHKPDILSSDYPIDFGDHLGSESPDDRPSRHQLPEEEPQRYRFGSQGRHSRVESDDASSYGRHSRHGRD